MDAEYLQGFYLGDLLIEPLKGRVSGRNGERHLPPKAAEVLVCLARHAGDELGPRDDEGEAFAAHVAGQAQADAAVVGPSHALTAQRSVGPVDVGSQGAAAAEEIRQLVDEMVKLL